MKPQQQLWVQHELVVKIAVTQLSLHILQHCVHLRCVVKLVS